MVEINQSKATNGTQGIHLPELGEITSISRSLGMESLYEEPPTI